MRRNPRPDRPFAGSASRRRAAEALSRAQISGDYRDLLAHLAGPQVALVEQVFRDDLPIVYIVTDRRRRQVWNAVLAAPETRDRLARDPDAADALFDRLMTDRSSLLLRTAFGPQGHRVLPALARVGAKGMAPDSYRRLVALTAADESLRLALTGLSHLSERLIDRVWRLPADLRSVRFASAIDSDRGFDRFVALLDAFEAAALPDRAGLRAALAEKVHAGRPIEPVMRDIYLRLPFPEPRLPETDVRKPMRCGLDMVAASRKFDNCLGDLVPRALSGHWQYYEFRARAHVVVCLRRHRGRWVLDEMRQKANRVPPPDIRARVVDDLRRAGIDNAPRLPELLEGFLPRGAFDLSLPLFGDEAPAPLSDFLDGAPEP